MPTRKGNEAEKPVAKKKKNEFEEAAEQAPKTVKLTPTMKKMQDFLKTHDLADKVDEVEERLLETKTEGIGKMPAVYCRFKGTDEEARETVKEALYLWMTMSTEEAKKYGDDMFFEVVPNDTICLFEAK